MNALELAILWKAVSAAVAEKKQAVDTEARALFEPGDRKTVWADGEKIGAIVLSDPKPGWKVKDRALFTRWVAEHHPDMTIEVVTTEVVVLPEWEKEFLRQPVDAETGEVPPGIKYGSATPAFTITPADGVIPALLPGLAAVLEIAHD